ncbi:MAG: hypothetical protein M3439_09145 [Chloroflexota bacterium]|nr:hypothetical protein [Chloroflexota bacterium]
MDVLIDQVQAYAGLYIALVVAAAAIGSLLILNVWPARRTHVEIGQSKRPDHERTVHSHHPFAGMDKSGP